jgi:branched-subunit amino acid transport protein
MNTWLTIVGMALVTYATRSLPLLTRWGAPHPMVERALRFVPASVLTALILPALLVPEETVQAGPELWAGLVGALIAWRTENVSLTIVIGLMTYGLARWLGSGAIALW